MDEHDSNSGWEVKFLIGAMPHEIAEALNDGWVIAHEQFLLMPGTPTVFDNQAKTAAYCCRLMRWGERETTQQHASEARQPLFEGFG